MQYYLDVISASGRQTVYLSEDGDGVARSGDNGGVLHHVFLEVLYWIFTRQFGSGNVKPHFVQHDGCVVILLKGIKFD